MPRHAKNANTRTGPLGPAAHGTFREDLQHWVNLYRRSPDCQDVPPGLVEATRLTLLRASVQATLVMRAASFLHRRRVPLLPGILKRLNVMLYGLDIVENVPIGGGLYLPHTVGTVIMAKRIGRNVTVVSNVTIGMRHEPEFPTIGNDVYIGAGARILGAITIGDGAVIGANAVVLDDVPAGVTAVGIPAKIIQRRPGERRPIKT